MTNLSLNDGDNVVVAMTVDMNSPNYHHLQVWQNTGVMAPDRYLIVTEGFSSRIDPNSFEMEYSGTVVLLVKDAASLKEFNDWWVKYSDRFDGLEHETFLPVPGNNFISGYMVSHTVPSGNVLHLASPMSYKEEWSFIVAHCPGKVYWTITHWIFTDHNDAVMFKLKKEIA